MDKKNKKDKEGQEPTVEGRLQQFKVIAYTRISEKLKEKFAQMPQIEFSEYVAFTADELAIRIIQSVWGEYVGDLVVMTPSNWWERLKKDHAPRWFLKRFPVRYDTTTYQAAAMYPKVTLPDEEHLYRWRRSTD